MFLTPCKIDNVYKCITHNRLYRFLQTSWGLCEWNFDPLLLSQANDLATRSKDLWAILYHSFFCIILTRREKMCLRKLPHLSFLRWNCGSRRAIVQIGQCATGVEFTGGKTEGLGEERTPAPICLPQIPHGLPWARTRASGMRTTATNRLSYDMAYQLLWQPLCFFV